MSPNNDPLIYRQEGEIAFIEINRPQKKNALNSVCWQLLDKYCDQMVAENQALEFENERAAENILSGQCIEGISAFLEKRAPNWKS